MTASKLIIIRSKPEFSLVKQIIRFLFWNYVEYNRQINDKFGVDAKLTTLAQNGNNISTFGLSDLFLNANYKANEKLKFTLGAILCQMQGNLRIISRCQWIISPV
jgi:hypothetical protein